MKRPGKEHNYFFVIGKRHWLLIEYVKVVLLVACAALLLTAILTAWEGVYRLQTATDYQNAAYERSVGRAASFFPVGGQDASGPIGSGG